MKKNSIKLMQKTSKFLVLALFLFITIISNPKPTSFVIINENNNLNKMIDLEKINEINNYQNTKAITELAKELTEETRKSLEKLSKNIDLGEPTGFTLQQFKIAILNSKYISNDRHDVIKSNINYFYNAEQKYGINGIFLLSIGVHESGWGTSKLAIHNNNLFGFTGMSFGSYENCIDYVAKSLMQKYLNEAGTKIKGLVEPATGIWYSGNTVSDVNKIYAADPLWADKVYEYMEHFYQNIKG